MIDKIIPEVKQVSNRGNKFAIVAGRVTLAKFKTDQGAAEELENNYGFWEYWANSIGTIVGNTGHKVIIAGS